jgi:hypothetical protein
MIMQFTQTLRSALHCQPSSGSLAAIALLAFAGGLTEINFLLGGKSAQARKSVAGILTEIFGAIQDEQNPDRLLQSGRDRRHWPELT